MSGIAWGRDDPRFVDLSEEVVIGRTFGTWVVVSTEVRRIGIYRHILVKCPNHAPVWKSWDNLRSGKSTNCLKCPRISGFISGERRSLKQRHDAMMGRCYNPKDRHYGAYGARGIVVEDFLQDSERYIAYVRSLPGYSANSSKHLDRVDNASGYSRDNLRWVLPAENQRNKRDNVLVEFSGVSVVYEDFLAQYTYISETGARNARLRGVPILDLPRIPPGRKSPHFWDYKNGVIQPKPPFTDLGWLK